MQKKPQPISTSPAAEWPWAELSVAGWFVMDIGPAASRSSLERLGAVGRAWAWRNIQTSLGTLSFRVARHSPDARLILLVELK